jgi:hypothetical protein
VTSGFSVNQWRFSASHHTFFCFRLLEILFWWILLFHRLAETCLGSSSSVFWVAKGLSVPSARREWLPARSTSTSAELSLGRRGNHVRRMHEHFYVIQLLNWGRCHPPNHIIQIRRGWLRQLWPNILVRMCRETDLSANPSRAPLYCGLCIDFWAPQLMISAGSMLYRRCWYFVF